MENKIDQSEIIAEIIKHLENCWPIEGRQLGSGQIRLETKDQVFYVMVCEALPVKSVSIAPDSLIGMLEKRSVTETFHGVEGHKKTATEAYGVCFPGLPTRGDRE
jgi:hypothetical protein